MAPNTLTRTCSSWSGAWQIVHFVLSTTVVVAWLVEFALPPPVFDSFPTFDRFKNIPTPDQVFAKVSPWGPSKPGIHRVMDTPIICTILLYYLGCFYLRFTGWSWASTSAAYSVVLIYCIVHFAAEDVFDWKFMAPRVTGITLQVASMAILGSVSLTLIQTKRRRFKFSVQPLTGTKAKGPSIRMQVTWNLVCNSVLYFVCLVMWTAGSYQSYVVIDSAQAASYLCQMTESVVCVACSNFSRNVLDECAANNTRASCHDKAMDPGFCLFNFSVGYFTFVRMFAFTGGLFFFLRNFINGAAHYAWLSVHMSSGWWRRHGQLGRMRSWRQMPSALQSLGGGVHDRSHRHSSRSLSSSDTDVEAAGLTSTSVSDDDDLEEETAGLVRSELDRLPADM